MHTLRLTQFAEGVNRHRVEVAYEGDGAARQAGVSRFEFAVSAQDQEDLRWYLEDYLQYPVDPAPKIAARVEARMAELGAGLFAAIFQSNDDARPQWLEHLNAALALYLETLKLIPEDAIADLAITQNQLGIIYAVLGDADRALDQFRRSINYLDAAGDLYGAAGARNNVAVTLARWGRFADAKDYAVAALRGFQTFGDGAKDDVSKTLKLIAQIDQAQKPGAGSQKSE